MLFFKPLFKKTRKIQFLKLRYKQFFWNKIILDSALEQTHPLDYTAKNWAVVHIAATHKHLIYDTSLILSYSEYLNKNAFFLRIKQMTVEFKNFPKLERNQGIFKEEYWRLFFIKKKNFEGKSFIQPMFYQKFYNAKQNSISFVNKYIFIKPYKLFFKNTQRLVKKPIFFFKTPKRKKNNLLRESKKRYLRQYYNFLNKNKIHQTKNCWYF